MVQYLEFEKAVEALETKSAELRAISAQDTSIKIDEDLQRLEKKFKESLANMYRNLTPWQKIQVARHPERPHAHLYIKALVKNFQPLAGDRKYAEDRALIAGIGWLSSRPVALIGLEKGSDTQSRLLHNFGMARPEGYRKAVRIMALANKFHLPVITFIDTSGAYPGIGAEERGQAEAIARATQACINLETPLIAVIIGEGGSGGAVSIATANKIFMLEHSVYSVASPEASATILWKDSKKAEQAADRMAITAQELLELEIIDEIIEEPTGGAHRDPEKAISRTVRTVEKCLHDLENSGKNDFRTQRREKFIALGSSL